MKSSILGLVVMIVTSTTAVNASAISGGDVTTFDHTAWDTLLQANVSSAGNVNYKAIKK